MSDERQIEPTVSDDPCEECAPTERDPNKRTAGTGAVMKPGQMPSRGAALSVLWWLEGEETPSDWTS